jgi:hypothetical protein
MLILDGFDRHVLLSREPVVRSNDQYELIVEQRLDTYAFAGGAMIDERQLICDSTSRATWESCSPAGVSTIRRAVRSNNGERSRSSSSLS